MCAWVVLTVNANSCWLTAVLWCSLIHALKDHPFYSFTIKVPFQSKQCLLAMFGQNVMTHKSVMRHKGWKKLGSLVELAPKDLNPAQIGDLSLSKLL